VTNFRTFRNGDAPALADLWNRGVPDSGAARPLTGHEFDCHVISKTTFDARGLIVAERQGRIIGFAHAGFGPDEPVGAPYRMNYELGTIAMLVVEPGPQDEELETGLVHAAEHYLRHRGAKVIYAGGQSPLNPFYWGLYGGSEFAGILSSHREFLRAVVRAGYESVSETVLMEADLDRPEVRDPRSPLIRRVARVEVVEDPPQGLVGVACHRELPTDLLSAPVQGRQSRAGAGDDLGHELVQPSRQPAPNRLDGDGGRSGASP